MKKIIFVIISVITVLTLLNVVSAVLLSDQGTDVRQNSTGALLEVGNLSVNIYDSASGGNLLFQENFTNAIVNGSWNLMISPNLEFGKIYWKDYSINGENLDFDGQDRIAFQSPLGIINNASLINFSLIQTCPTGSSIRQINEDGSVECQASGNGSSGNSSSLGTNGPYLYNDSSFIYLNESILNDTIDMISSYSNGSGISLTGKTFSLVTYCSDGQILKWNSTSSSWQCSEDSTGGNTNLSNYALKNQSETFSGNITTSETGFFGFLGSIFNRITKLFVKDIDASGDVNVTGNVSASYFIGDGSLLTNLPAGINGSNGVDGLNGTNGIDGRNGTNGIDGRNGTDGLNGTNGVNGVDGLNGTNGIDGRNGTDGLNGSQGIPGINGTNGIDGRNGTFTDIINSTQMTNTGGILNILESWLRSIFYSKSEVDTNISNAIISLDNTTIARTGSCPDGQVVMNTTNGGVQCVPLTGNSTFNQSLTDSLYAPVLWGYNQTTGAVTIIMANINANNTAWLSTYNATYASWAYNQTTDAISIVKSSGFYNSSNIPTTGNSSYYLVSNPFNYYNSSTIPTTGNSSYPTLTQLFGYNYYNSTSPPPGINASWNQTLADSLYAPVLWGYNQTTGAVTIIMANINANNTAWLSTYNATYASWAYNQTTDAISIVKSSGFYNSSNIPTTGNSSYYLVSNPFNYYNSSTIPTTGNSSYPTLTQLFGYAYYNSTSPPPGINASWNQTLADSLYAPVLWGYNQTTGAVTIIMANINANNTAWLSTYNATYASWAYNQTTDAISIVKSSGFYNSSNIPTTGNSSYYLVSNPFNYYNSSTIPTTGNSSYPTLTQLFGYAYYNSTSPPPGINASWNQTLADSLYAPVLWGYNQTTGAVTIIMANINANNTAWLSTYNATYASWAYNQTTDAISIVKSSGFYNSSNIPTTGNSSYYLVSNPFNYYNSSTIPTTGNSSYPTLTQLFGYAYYNSTSPPPGINASWNQTLADSLYAPVLWGYNQTTGAVTIIMANINANNTAWLSTYNATYASWAYNQTTDAISIVKSSGFYNSSNIPTTGNSSYYLVSNPFNYYNSSTIPTTGNSSYPTLTQLFGYAYYNSTSPPPGINASWNQTLADSLYAPVLWGYNQTTGAVTIIMANINANNTAWLSTYNATYASWAYNQTTDAISIIKSAGYYNSTTIPTTGNSSYYLVSNPFNYYNSSTIPTTGNSSYPTFTQLYGFSYYNSTNPPPGINASWNQTLADSLYAPVLWGYNQTTGAVTIIMANINANNTAWLSTFNSTYNNFAYNQTTDAISYVQNNYANISSTNSNNSNNYYSILNPFGYYNSSTLPASGNPFDQVLNTTSNVTFNQLSLNSSTILPVLNINRRLQQDTLGGGSGSSYPNFMLYDKLNYSTTAVAQNYYEMYNTLEDSRRVTGGGVDGLVDFNAQVERGANYNGENPYTKSTTVSTTAFLAYLLDGETYNKTNGIVYPHQKATDTGIQNQISITPKIDLSGTKIFQQNVYGVYTILQGITPTILSGKYAVNYTGYYSGGVGTTTANFSTRGYGYYNDLTGFNYTYGFYNAQNTPNVLGINMTSMGILNVTNLMMLQANTLPTCSTTGEIARNDTNTIYYCNGTDWRLFSFAY